jgi:hypothetical protein
MKDEPLVSVVMAVYNGELYLREAVESILDQTYHHLEFIIVNDGSTDSSADILTDYERMDDRVHVCHQQNQGVSAALNRGCRLATGKYNARMDADDVSLPERLAKQVSYMEGHPDIGVLGGWTQSIDESGRLLKSWSMPTLPGVVGWSLLFGNCIAHSSVMIRSEVLERVGFYSSGTYYAVDYDLFARATAVTRIANLPEILVRRRIWDGSSFAQQHQNQEQTVLRGMFAMHSRLLGPGVSAQAVASLRLPRSHLEGLERIEPAVDLVHRLYAAYTQQNLLSQEESREVAESAARKLYHLSAKAGAISPWRGLAVSIRALRQGPRSATARILSKAVWKRTRNAFLSTQRED